MDETKISPETNVQDTIQEENNAKVTDSLGNFIQGIVSNTLAHFHSKPKEDSFEELKPILEDIRDSLKKQSQVNKELYDDLVSLQNDSLRRGLLKSIIGIHSLMEENFDYIVNKMPQDFEGNIEGQRDKTIELFAFIKGRIEELLIYTYGLRVISPSSGDVFNPDEHNIVGTVPASDESLKNTIHHLEKAGFKDAGSNFIFKRADVITVDYREEKQLDSNNYIND